MHSMQRQFGKLLNKGPGDNAKVAVILSDYDDVDRVLAKLIDSTKAWRESWASLVGCQLQAVIEFESLYDPIVGASDGHGAPSKPTPDLQLRRTYSLKQAYGELKTDMIEEIGMIDERCIKPAVDARDCLQPIRKTIKKRENKRIDYEKAQEKLQKLQRKPGRSAKEEAALFKAEEEMSRTAEEFGIADDHLRATLPPLVNAAFSLVPPLIAAHILIQNRLLGLYYTALNGYCEEFGFPSPPPPMEQVIANWEADFKPIQAEVESITCIARGRGIHQPLSPNGDRKPSIEAPPRRSSSSLISTSNNNSYAPRTLRVPSYGSLRPTTPSAGSDISPQPSPRPSPRSAAPLGRDYLAPTDFTTATILGGATVDRTSGTSAPTPNSLRPDSDYFNSRRTSTSTIASTTSQGSMTLSSSYGLIAKKKPPPPPPPKRKPEEWVVALYTFSGQGQGDLSFREGDRIKIVQKTATDQDWWVGELNGLRGSFPANYCRAA